MDLATKQYLIALGIFAAGLSGWLLPYKWNLFKVRRPYSKYVSEQTNMRIAKVLGTLFMVVGVFMVVLTAMGEDFTTRP